MVVESSNNSKGRQFPLSLAGLVLKKREFKKIKKCKKQIKDGSKYGQKKKRTLLDFEIHRLA